MGYNLSVMRKSACLVCNPFMVGDCASFFNCAPVGRASGSVLAPAWVGCGRGSLSVHRGSAGVSFAPDCQ